MQEVLIDVTRLVGRFRSGRLATGVDRVSLAYVRHYFARACAVVRWHGWTLVLPPAESKQLFLWLLSPKGKLLPALIIFKGATRAHFIRQVPGRVLFNTGHSGVEQADYPAKLKEMRVRPLLMVHDLIPITHAEYCRAGERERHVSRISNILAAASGIVAISQTVLDELTAYAAATQQRMPPAIAALIASGMAKFPVAKRPLAPPYFVILSTIEPRKNHYFLLQLWRALIERYGAAAPRLLVIGQRGWDCGSVVNLLERSAPLQGFVSEISHCSDSELANYLHHAQALLFPSFAEGYGMPLVEALEQGVPVIASDLAVFKEVGRDIPDYADPLDGKRWAELIMAYADNNHPLRLAQLARLQGCALPTWDAHFAQVDALLAQMSER